MNLNQHNITSEYASVGCANFDSMEIYPYFMLRCALVLGQVRSIFYLFIFISCFFYFFFVVKSAG